ncbi:serine/threonine-protein kinase [Actinoplanes sp. NPDC048796]|uniref:serine/threonine-protein kinase n=1 Tax=unclassified Actinoplanes TaxID=2626549 RepID=UPI0034001956
MSTSGLTRFGGWGHVTFATVWLAYDEELHSSVAVKVLAENWTHQLDVRARFTEEARIMRRAESERVVRVLDVGELPDGRPYLVMTYAPDGTLAERLESGPLPVAEAVRVSAELARGVTVLHELGVLHRDLKPSNVLFDGDRVLVADLGLAKALAQGSGFTIVAGSPGYMAPEQARIGGGLDERADVYSLGALAYHMLTGEPPASQPAVRPSKLRPGIPAAVDAVVLRALSPAPGRRWPSAAAFAEAVEAARTDKPARRSIAGRLAVTAALSAVTVLAGTAWDAARNDKPEWTRVADASGALSVWVPGAWAKQVRDTGWDPGTIRLRAGRDPGLTVGPDLTGWSNPDNPAPGVFAGISPALRGGRPALPDHSTCVPQPDAHPRLVTGSAVVRRWTGCGSGAISFTEALITPATGDVGLYVQIRQTDDIDHSEEILRGVRLG